MRTTCARQHRSAHLPKPLPLEVAVEPRQDQPLVLVVGGVGAELSQVWQMGQTRGGGGGGGGGQQDRRLVQAGACTAGRLDQVCHSSLQQRQLQACKRKRLSIHRRLQACKLKRRSIYIATNLEKTALHPPQSLGSRHMLPLLPP